MIRSFLYVPGDRADRVAKALASDADAVLIDLEDAVALSAKAAARGVVRCLAKGKHSLGPQIWVRINAGDVGRTDIAALAPVSEGLSGLVLAKCDDPAWLDEASSFFPPSLPLSPLVESALALRRLDVLCAHPRVRQCQLGELDLLADLGGVRPAADRMLDYARNELVCASAAAGIMPPIGGVFPDIRNLELLAEDSRLLAGIGFAGRPALHPRQLPGINAAFRPSAEEIAAAKDLVSYYDEALQRGSGAVSDAAGRMIDEAVVRRARRLLRDLPSGLTPGRPDA